MTPQRNSNDDATGRRLWLLIGLVVVLALAVVAGSVRLILEPGRPIPSIGLLIGFVILTAFASRMMVRIRLQSGKLSSTWLDLAIVVGLVLLPPPWVVLGTAVAITAPKLFVTTTTQRILFAVGKETLVAAACGALFLLSGYQPAPERPSVNIGLMAAAVAVMWLADELIAIPVLAVATHRSMRQMFLIGIRLSIVMVISRFVLAVLIVAILRSSGDARLLLIVPPVMLSVHFWQAGHERGRQERESWQRLADTTDELNVVELDEVLRNAVIRACQLFTAIEAEIRLPADDRVVRGSNGAIAYDGPMTEDTRAVDTVETTELSGHDGNNPIGSLRIHFQGPVRLTESEHFKLKAFSSALYTAIRNAKAYAELGRIAAANAHAATHDPLTGLPNRRQLYERAGQLFRAGTDQKLFALLLIDLNHFKEVNDTLGHGAGDKVLQMVAAHLRDAATPNDLVARLGGDEFAVLLGDLPTPALATHRAEALLSALEIGVEVEGMQIVVEAAGGIALAPGSGGIDELMRRADVAMYQAKRAGDQTMTYAHSRDTADVGRLMLGGELRRAVSEQEFVVDFQPIVDLGTGEVISAEALARWHHPEHGPLTPIQFLETVERSGQLPAFANAVLNQALTAAGVWREAGFDMPIAVNVSPRSLLDPTFPRTVLGRLEHYTVPADRLVLELTETLTISQLDVVGRALAELREAGVRLALDDFGTGLTPLSVLSRIPVHQLKIDREFVTAIETSSEAAAVIRSTVDLARNLHLTVIAEGVESEPQRHALWESGCVAGQGHLFARAMSSPRLLATLQRGTGGRPGALAAALHDEGSVVRMPRRRSPGSGRKPLPHLPA
ncbi:bifunctional diguanylate cyclase/phosphodiesterase [Actinoplanes sp. NPDC051411]|uniref:putative bifunctional diguanylate cyclase/phosphodiesterase n=1 Tax=Actinoplanes sp. NPDC051411 TaxID=3155522 RepID=UPI00342ADE01